MNRVMNSGAVTLLLDGGHLLPLAGDIDVPALIRQLGPTFTIAANGDTALHIRQQSLIGVMESAAHRARPTRPDAVDETPTIEFKADTHRRPSSPYVHIKNFLPQTTHAALIQRVLERQSDFKRTTVTSDVPDYRQSLFLDEDPVIASLIVGPVKQAMQDHARALCRDAEDPSRAGRIECQTTAHPDGGFYRTHNDNGSECTRDRFLTYVYYFRARPQAFYGGELKLYGKDPDNMTDDMEVFDLISPEDNSIVLFRSEYLHEVLPTNVPSGKFEDSRFTVNGWFRTA